VVLKYQRPGGNMGGKYIYGIIKDGGKTALDIAGLDRSSKVYTVPYRGLSCVLSDYSGGEFSSMSEEEVIRCLLKHQVVVENVMREHTILPVKFGTVLATLSEVYAMLSQGYSQFSNALDWIQGRVEIEVAATWEMVQVLQEVNAERQIIRAWEAIASRPEQQTIQERIHLCRMVRASMNRRRSSYRERIINFLKSVAVDVQPNALVSDELVVNMAFLVERTCQERFDNCVRWLDALFHSQIKFLIIGPLPPYSFVTVEVTRLSPAKAESGGSFLINIKRQRNDEVPHLRFAEIGGIAQAVNY